VKAIALGCVCAAALVAALVAASTASTTLSSPLRPESPWDTILVAAIATALVAYLVSLAAARRRPPGVRSAAAVAILMQLAPLALGPMLSTDVYTYWMYGRVGAVHGANPYDDPPLEFPRDPALERMGLNWRGTTSLYGPSFTLGSEAVAAASGDSPTAAAWAFKSLAAAGMVAIVLLVSLLGRRPGFSVAFVGWNPLLPLHFAGGGHNDSWMIALVLAALVLERRGRERLGGAAWALAVTVKWVPLVLLPLHWLARRQHGLRLGVVGFVAGLAGVAFAATLRYGTDWVSAGGGLSRQARSTGSLGLSDVLRDLGFGHRAILVSLALGFAAVYLALVVQALRGRERLALAAGAFALAQGWLNPWYAVWPIALAAVEEDRLARGVALVLTVYLLRDAVPL
jgi:hypothetical protein